MPTPRIVHVVRRDTELKVAFGLTGTVGIEQTVKKGDNYRSPNRADIAVSTFRMRARSTFCWTASLSAGRARRLSPGRFRATPAAHGGPSAFTP